MRLFPAASAPNPHDRLQMAYFTYQMLEDETEHQKERYTDAFLRLQAVNPKEAVTTLEEWRVALFEAKKPPSLFDAMKADPVTMRAIIPDELLRAEAERNA